MDLKLAGKIAIVTGASRGIGRAIAETLSAEGVKIVLAARSVDLLDSLSSRLPTQSIAYPVDLRYPESAPALSVLAQEISSPRSSDGIHHQLHHSGTPL